MTDDLLTTVEAAALAGCSEGVIRKNLTPAKVQTRHISRRRKSTNYLYTRADVVALASLDPASRRRAAAARRKQDTLTQRAAELAACKAQYDESLHRRHELHVGDPIALVHKGRLARGYMLGPLLLDEDPAEWAGVTVRHGNAKRPRFFGDEGVNWDRRPSLSREDLGVLMAAAKLTASNPE